MYDPKRNKHYYRKRNKPDYKKLFSIIIGIIILILITLGVRAIIIRGGEPTLNMVSGTEYISGEEGQVISRISDRNGNAILGADCFATIFYPDKSYFLLERPMTQAPTSENYFLTFTTPTITGIYEYNVRCLIGGDEGTEITTAKSFHVSPAYNIIAEMNTMNYHRHQEILAEINETRNKLLNELNEAFSEEILSQMQIYKNELSTQMEQNKNESIQAVEDNFQDFKNSMVQLGIQIQQIFE